ncbi:MAG: helix-hairpin-helix domain-containing protein [Candidatus Thorarchaeota archaeon]
MSKRPTRRSLIGSYRYSVVIKPEEKEFGMTMNGSLDLYDGKHVIETHKYTSFDQLATIIINFWEKMLGTDVNIHRFSNWLSEYFHDIGILNINFYQLLENVRNLGKGVSLQTTGLEIREAKVIREPLEPSKPKGLPAEITDAPGDMIVKPSEILKTEQTISPEVTTLPPIKEEKAEATPPPDDTLLVPSETLKERETIVDVEEAYVPTFMKINGDPVVTKPIEPIPKETHHSETLLRPSEYLKQRETISAISGPSERPSQIVEEQKKTSTPRKPISGQQIAPPSEKLLKPSDYLKDKEKIDVLEEFHIAKPSEVLKYKETIPAVRIDPTVKGIPVPYEKEEKKIEVKKEEILPTKKSELPFEIEIIESEKGEPFKITDILGVGDKTAMLLKDGGFGTIESVINSTPEELSKIRGIGITTAKKIIYGARALKQQIDKNQ